MPTHGTRLPVFIAMLAALLAIGIGGLACSADVNDPTRIPSENDRPSPIADDGQSNKILYMDTQLCPVLDPAIDLWDTGNGIGAPSLVPEIHAGLTKFTDDDQQPVELELAQSYNRSDDGRSYDFTLRPGLTFSDGPPVLAADFKRSWERALRLGTDRGYAAQLMGEILGAGDVIEGSTTNLAGVDAVDDRTLAITLEEPSFSFEMNLAHPVASVVNSKDTQLWEELWDNETDHYAIDAPSISIVGDRLPSGAGPFRLTAYESSPQGMRCVISRNARYHGVPPELDHIVLTDKSSQVVPVRFPTEVFAGLFESLELDIDPWILLSLTEEQMSDIESVEGVVAANTPVDMAIVAINPNRPPLDEPWARRILISNAYPPSDPGRPLPLPDRLTPPQLGGGIAEVTPSNGEAPMTENSLDIIDGSGSAPFYILDDSVAVRFGYDQFMSQITERWWEDYGFAAWTISADRNTKLPQDFNGIHDFRLWQFTLQVPHPSTVLGKFDRAFSNDAQPAEIAELHAMFDSIRESSDAARQRQAYADIEQYIIDNSLGFAIGWNSGLLPVRVQPYVHGYVGATFPRSQFHKVWMDDSAPERPNPLR